MIARQILDSLGGHDVAAHNFSQQADWLSYLLVALSMITRKQATLESVTALLHNPSMMFIVGIITLAAGLGMVLGHNLWSGGARVVVVTLVGWITLIKSLFFLLLSPEMEAGFFLRQLRYEELFYFYGAVSIVLGVYLTYGGFRQRQISQHSHA